MLQVVMSGGFDFVKAVNEGRTIIFWRGGIKNPEKSCLQEQIKKAQINCLQTWEGENK